MANYIRYAGKAVAEAYDGTAATAATLVSAYPTVLSVYKAEGTTGTGILSVITDAGSIQQAYKDTYIVWEDTIVDYVETTTIRVWSKADFEKYFVSAT